MLKIGHFSMLTKISIHMLRNYDKIGLLIPVYVDAESGYRYYSENQLTVANRIQALKSMGLGLATIKDILCEYKDSESLAAYLKIQTTYKQEELERLQQQIRQLETTVAALRKNENILRYSVEVKQIPSRTVVSIRDTIPFYDREGDLWSILSRTLEQQQIPFETPAYDMAIYHNEGFVESGIDIELQRAVAWKGRDTDNVIFKEVSSTLAAVLTYEGEYHQISEIGELIANWAKDNHYTFCGQHFNIYHVSPATEKNAQKMVTEVGFPIQSL